MSTIRKSSSRATSASRKAPIVTDIKIKGLRKKGFNSIKEWIDADPKHIYVEGVRASKDDEDNGTFSSMWAKPQGVKTLEQYRTHVKGRADLMAALGDLTGAVLGCFAHPQPSHAGVLVELYCEQFGIEPAGPVEDEDVIGDDKVVSVEIKINGQFFSQEQAYALIKALAARKDLEYTINDTKSTKPEMFAVANIVAGTYKPRTDGKKTTTFNRTVGKIEREERPPRAERKPKEEKETRVRQVKRRPAPASSSADE